MTDTPAGKAATPAIKPRLTARRIRKTLTWPVNLQDGSVLLRRCDIMNEVLLGHLPGTILRHTDIFERMAVEIGIKSAGGEVISIEDAIANMPEDDKTATLEMLRLYACHAIVDPVYTMTDDGDDAHVPIETLASADLLRVWNAVPPADVDIDPAQPLAAPATEEAASRFPAATDGRVEEHPEPPVSDRDPALPTVEGVEVQTVITPDGGLVEFAHG